MNEIQIYHRRLNIFILFIMGLIGAGGAWWFQAIMGQMWFGVMGGALVLSFLMLIKLFRRRRPHITMTVHGIQFFYETLRLKAPIKQQLNNQFVAWEDIDKIELKGKTLHLQIDDNPPDYERLTEIELENLPPREPEWYYLKASLRGLNVSAKQLFDWIGKMQQSPAKNRSTLILAFHYEK